MAVKLRFTRMGRKKQPTYRLVATDSRSKRDGRFVEILGFYHPKQKTNRVTFKMDRVSYWLEKGATPSATVARLLKNEKSGGAAKAESTK